MKKVTINLYDINELGKDERAKAIQEHKDFLIDTFRKEDYDECFKMTRSKYARGLTNAEVIDNIQANEYAYFSNGSMASVVKYVGQHPKSGQEILTLEGEKYNI